MKTILHDIAFGSRKWLPSGRNVPLRRHFSKSLLRYFWKCRRSHFLSGRPIFLLPIKASGSSSSA